MNDEQLLQTIQHISGLLLRKQQGSITEEEQTELTAWLNGRTAADRRFLEEALDEEQIEAGLYLMYQLNEEAALADVLNRAQLPVATVIPVVAVTPKRPWLSLYKLTAAAVVTGAIISTVVFVNKHKETSPAPVAGHYNSEVQPGGDKAMLTLADGRTIVLDSVQNGAIANDGSIVVNKQEGAVVYEHAATANTNTAVSYNTLSTPRGGQYKVVLPDGSQVWLNAASSITYPTAFSSNERKVSISGEAYFEVHKDAAHPFRVVVAATATHPESVVEVLGTHFNVNAYNDENVVRTTLLEGKVRVNQLAISNGQLAKNAERSVVLKPGEQAVLAAALPIHDSRFTIHDADVEEATAWKNGLFQFQDATLPTIMRQIARWYNVEIEYKGNIDKQFIGKIPRHVPLSTLLQILESTGWVHFKIEGAKVIVSP